VENESLLHIAVRLKSVKLVKSLGKQKIKWITKNSEGVTPIEMAVKLENETISTEMVEFMLSKMSKKEHEVIGERLMEECKYLQ